MASPTVPYHGKTGSLYALRPNVFKGDGLNDVTWGTGSTALDLTYYEVEIDGDGGLFGAALDCRGSWFVGHVSVQPEGFTP